MLLMSECTYVVKLIGKIESAWSAQWTRTVDMSSLTNVSGFTDNPGCTNTLSNTDTAYSTGVPDLSGNAETTDSTGTSSWTDTSCSTYIPTPTDASDTDSETNDATTHPEYYNYHLNS